MDSFFSFMNKAKTAVMGSFFYIHSMYDFIDFAGNVNSGMTYEGTTVVLETDLNFSDYFNSFSPIGLNPENPFMGTFDGKGHTLSNLNIVTSSEYAGLFGYTKGATISNLIFDVTCSVTSNSMGLSIYIGGIVGYCTATTTRECVIDKCMSSAKVIFTGKGGNSLERVGGIVGGCKSKIDKGCTISNSMSYGVVKHSGSGKSSAIGGICGSCKSKYNDNDKCTIYNSGTYSPIIFNGAVNENPTIGGILGFGKNAIMENCVGASSISLKQKAENVGCIAGTLEASNIISVFWEETQSVKNACGREYESTSLDGSSRIPSRLHEDTVAALNRHALEKRGLSRNFFTLFGRAKLDWALFHMNGGSINGIKRSVVLTHRAFAPVPKKAHKIFSFWCENETLEGSCGVSPLRSNSQSFYAKYDHKIRALHGFDTRIFYTIAIALITPIFRVIVSVHHRKQQKSETMRNLRIERIKFYGENGDSIWNKIDPSKLGTLYQDGLTNQSLESALLYAGFTQEQTNEICINCAQVAEKVSPSGNITKEDIMNIAMYTFDFNQDNDEINPYRVINKALAGGNVSEFKRISGMLYLLVNSLRKLPRVSGKFLYRGTNKEMNKNEYEKGKIVTWAGFSSTSTDMDVTKNFLKKNKTNSDNFVGAIFIIENGWGYDINNYSFFPSEKEVLLEPGRKFKVKSMMKQSNLNLISLEMIDSPLISFDINNASYLEIKRG